MENNNAIGVDLSKHIYAIHAVNPRGGKIYRQKMERERFLKEVSLEGTNNCVYMEACSGAHYLCWELEKRGVQAKQIDTREVKKYASHQKNDYRDAEAIAIAGTRENTKFVTTKTKEQLDLQVQLRVRERLIKNQTALINEMRGFLMEQGVIINQSKAAFEKYLSQEYHQDDRFSASFRQTLDSLIVELRSLQEQLTTLERRLKLQAQEIPACVALDSIPGLGWLTALCIVITYGDGAQFKNGRHLAAATGLVPRQFSTGGITTLGRITKCGNSYLRYLLVHGGRAVVRSVLKKDKKDAHSLWIKRLYERKGYNKTAVAVANKNARIAFRILRDPTIRYEDAVAQRAMAKP